MAVGWVGCDTLRVLPLCHSLTAASGFPRVPRREAERTEATCDQSTASLQRWPLGGGDPVGTVVSSFAGAARMGWLCSVCSLKGSDSSPPAGWALPRQLKSDSLVHCLLWKHDRDVTLTGHLWSCRVRHSAGVWLHPPKCSSLRAAPGPAEERLGLMAGGGGGYVPRRGGKSLSTLP